MTFRIRLTLALALVGGLLLAAFPALAATTVYTGTLDFDTNPYDDYPVWIEAGTAASATLDCTVSDGLDPFLIAYGPDGSVITSSDDGLGNDCNDGSGSALAFVASTSGFYTFRATSWDYAIEGDDWWGSDTGDYILAINGAIDAPGGYIPTDDRLNIDPAPPVVIYCREYGIDIYARDANDNYQFALRVPAADYEELGTPATNTLLGTSPDGNVRLFLLSTGEFQVNAYFGNEEYVAIWSGCPGIGLDISVYDRTTGELLAKGNFPVGANAPNIPPLMPGEFGGEREGEAELPPAE